MDLSSTEAIYTSTSSLVHEVAASILDQNAGGFGSFTPAVYDTAWLAMIVRRSGNDTQELLFPDYFTYLIQEQKEEGTWDCYESRTDEILNSLAALLAILKYSQRDICSPTERVLLEPRISKAKLAISRLLAGWDVSSTCHVGYEVLVPSLLEQLSSYSADFGEFPGRSLLYRLNARKMEKFPLNALYTKDQNTLLHSLEAFVGKNRLSALITSLNRRINAWITFFYSGISYGVTRMGFESRALVEESGEKGNARWKTDGSPQCLSEYHLRK
jgi:hypothetical protein